MQCSEQYQIGKTPGVRSSEKAPWPKKKEIEGKSCIVILQISFTWTSMYWINKKEKHVIYPIYACPWSIIFSDTVFAGDCEQSVMATRKIDKQNTPNRVWNRFWIFCWNLVTEQDWIKILFMCVKFESTTVNRAKVIEVIWNLNLWTLFVTLQWFHR